jgi:hypothetical protein
VLPAALHKTNEPFSNLDITFGVIYKKCHRGPIQRRASPSTSPRPPDRTVPHSPPTLFARPRPCSLAHRQARVPAGGAGRSSAVVLPGRRPPRQTSSPAVLLPGRPFSHTNSFFPGRPDSEISPPTDPSRRHQLSSSAGIFIPGSSPPRPISSRSN